MALELNGTTGVSLVQDGVVTAADLAFTPGKILQIVQTSSTVQFTSTSTSFVATNITGSITPSSTSSKILIISEGVLNTNGTDERMALTIYRGATNLGVGSFSGLSYFHISGGQGLATLNMHYIDSPSTTSSTTYTVYYRVTNGTSSGIRNELTGGRMILMEIAA